MTILKNKFYFIIKRGMHTTTEKLQEEDKKTIEPTLPTEKKQIVIDEMADDTEAINTELAATENPTTFNWRNIVPKIKANLQNQNKNSSGLENSPGNETVEEPLPLPPEPLFIRPSYATEVLLTDTVMKTTVANLDELGSKLDVEIKKSTELAVEWKTHIVALDKYVQSLSKLPWKKTLTYGACLITFLLFLWRMGSLKTIPNFLGNIITLIPSSTISTTKTAIQESVSVKDTGSTLSSIMETPVTPLVIVTSVGLLTISLGLLKALVWVLRKAPK